MTRHAFATEFAGGAGARKLWGFCGNGRRGIAEVRRRSGLHRCRCPEAKKPLTTGRPRVSIADMEVHGAAPDPSHPPVPPATDWLNAVRAYVNEDWLTTGMAEYLEVLEHVSHATRHQACLGCGHRFPRADLWVHHRFGELAYCDACYYRRFGRQPA